MQKKIIIPTAEKMQEFGNKLGNQLHRGDIIFLKGQLGAGKTTLVRGILQGLGYEDKVKSPTFTLVESYSLPSAMIFHFDFYRLRDVYELLDIGIQDYFTEDAIVLIEWPENAISLLPHATVDCEISLKEEGREIILHAENVRGLEILKPL